MNEPHDQLDLFPEPDHVAGRRDPWFASSRAGLAYAVLGEEGDTLIAFGHPPAETFQALVREVTGSELPLGQIYREWTWTWARHLNWCPDHPLDPVDVGCVMCEGGVSPDNPWLDWSIPDTADIGPAELEVDAGGHNRADVRWDANRNQPGYFPITVLHIEESA